MKDRSLTVINLLGISFIILKLCDVINWSWWLVTLPFWYDVAILGLVFAFVFVTGSNDNKKETKKYNSLPNLRKSKFEQKLAEAMEKQKHKQN